MVWAKPRQLRRRRLGPPEHDDVALAAGEIEPGATAVMIVCENRWAAPY
ncbi:MAG: hypothetical protein ACLP22_11245 [Solirubrobacteraceae bacterium]